MGKKKPQGGGGWWWGRDKTKAKRMGGFFTLLCGEDSTIGSRCCCNGLFYFYFILGGGRMSVGEGKTKTKQAGGQREMSFATAASSFLLKGREGMGGGHKGCPSAYMLRWGALFKKLSSSHSPFSLQESHLRLLGDTDEHDIISGLPGLCGDVIPPLPATGALS